MKQLLLIFASLTLMLYLPAMIKSPSGEPYLIIRENTHKHLYSYTHAYQEVLKNISASNQPAGPSTEVFVWQDHQGNLHFSDKEQHTFQQSQIHTVDSKKTGRLAFPKYWVWAFMLLLWLMLYISALLGQWGIKKIARKLVEKKEGLQFTRKLHNHGQNKQNQSETNHTSTAQNLLPHQILEIHIDASAEEIKAAYRSKIRQYHPDRVATMGAEIQILAKQKAADINRAYEALIKNH